MPDWLGLFVVGGVSSSVLHALWLLSSTSRIVPHASHAVPSVFGWLLHLIAPSPRAACRWMSLGLSRTSELKCRWVVWVMIQWSPSPGFPKWPHTRQHLDQSPVEVIEKKCSATVTTAVSEWSCLAVGSMVLVVQWNIHQVSKTPNSIKDYACLPLVVLFSQHACSHTKKFAPSSSIQHPRWNSGMGLWHRILTCLLNVESSFNN